MKLKVQGFVSASITLWSPFALAMTAFIQSAAATLRPKLASGAWLASSVVSRIEVIVPAVNTWFTES